MVAVRRQTKVKIAKGQQKMREEGSNQGEK